MGTNKKLGRFDAPEEAFAEYKKCKEKLVKEVAESYKDKLPCKVYEAMVNWEIEIRD